MTKVEKHQKICSYLNNLYQKKNADYGDSFGDCYKRLGIISAATRISDKCNRFCNLITKPSDERQVRDENIADTLVDLANYAIMTLIELTEEE